MSTLQTVLEFAKVTGLLALAAAIFTAVATVVSPLLQARQQRGIEREEQRQRHRRRVISALDALAFDVMTAKAMPDHQDRQQQLAVQSADRFHRILDDCAEGGYNTLALAATGRCLAKWQGHVHRLGHDTPQGAIARAELPAVLAHLSRELAAAGDKLEG